MIVSRAWFTAFLMVLSAPAGAGGEVVVDAEAAPPPVARSEADAERYRLEQELDRLAQRSTWPGVERVYGALLMLQVPLGTHVHFVAAQAAEARGDMLESWVRLERALREKGALDQPVTEGFSVLKTLPESVDESVDPGAAARLAFDALRSRYGRVEIVVEKGRVPALIRTSEKPFSATEREAIQRGQKLLVDDLRYAGLLPVGRYMIDGEFFEVKAGESHAVTVARR